MSSPITAWHQLPHAPAVGTRLCDWADLEDGSIRMLALGPEPKPFRLLVLRSGQQFTAFVNRCAHFGVPLAAQPQHLIFEPHVSFSCNVHYARYDWRDGRCLGGDCDGEGLLPVPVRVQGDGLWVG